MTVQISKTIITKFFVIIIPNNVIKAIFSLHYGVNTQNMYLVGKFCTSNNDITIHEDSKMDKCLKYGMHHYFRLQYCETI